MSTDINIDKYNYDGQHIVEEIKTKDENGKEVILNKKTVHYYSLLPSVQCSFQDKERTEIQNECVGYLTFNNRMFITNDDELNKKIRKMPELGKVFWADKLPAEKQKELEKELKKYITEEAYIEERGMDAYTDLIEDTEREYYE
jgi:hypothetical protein